MIKKAYLLLFLQLVLRFDQDLTKLATRLDGGADASSFEDFHEGLCDTRKVRQVDVAETRFGRRGGGRGRRG